MRSVEQLQLPLWEVLKEATIAPDEANLKELLDGLETALSYLDTVGQLQVAAEAITQIVQVFQDRSTLAFEELEATNNNEGPVMPTHAFDDYVRQTMEINFEPFIEPLESLPRKIRERQMLSEEQGSVVGELDREALLQELDEQMSQHPELTEAEIFNQAIAIAHGEDVLAWGKLITQWMAEQKVTTIPLVQLQQSMEMPLAQLWLALLMGEHAIEQHGEFYETEQIWVTAQGDS
jgi:hypothetical protein